MSNKPFLLIVFFGFSFFFNSQTYVEDFEDVSTLNDWYFQNNSDSLNLNWLQGNQTNFSAHQGGDESYLGVGYESSNALNPATLSNWAISPSRTFNNGDILTFYSRRKDFTPVFPDRLEVRLSSEGNEINVGYLAEDVGSFSTLLLSINPSLTQSGYPNDWTQYTIIMSGLDGPTNGRIGFRYYVTDGGPGGSNSNYIGIDSFTYYSSLTPIANDDCENAIAVDHNASCVPEIGSLQVATESLPGCTGTANNDVWYQFTANTNAASINVNGSNEMDAVFEVYSGTCNTLSSLNCTNNSYDGEAESTTVSGLNAGQTYYVRIYDWHNWVPNTLDFSLCIEAFEQCTLSAGINSSPENEACGNNENGGCFVSSPIYQDVSCNETIFGTSWAQNGLKDYDWYRIEIINPGEINIPIQAEFAVTVDVFNIANCNIPQLITSGSFSSCSQELLTSFISPGVYAVVVKPTSSNNMACGDFNHYEIGFELPVSDIVLSTETDTLSFCEGNETYLASNQMGGLFSWVFDGQSVSNQDSILLTQSGELFLSYTNENGCAGNTSNTIQIEMNAINVAAFNYESTTLCIGQGTVANDNIETGYYDTSDGLSIDTLTGTINTDLSETGNYNIMHQTTGICPDSSSNLITIGTYAEVLFTVTSVLCDTSLAIQLEGLPMGGTFLGEGVINESFTPSIAGVGTHTLSYSYDNNGCITTESQEVLVENCASTNELEFEYAIWPNPFKDMIFIDIPKETYYSLISLQGHVLAKGFNTGNTTIEIDASALVVGMYLIQLENNKQIKTLPLIKK